MADLILKTDKGTFNAFGGPTIDCVAIPFGKKQIFLHAVDGGIVASKDAPTEPEVPSVPENPPSEEPAEDNAKDDPGA